MASRTLSAALRKSTYICDSCLSNAQFRRSARAGGTRVLSTASSRKSENTLSPTSPLARSKRRPTALRGVNDDAPRRWASSRLFSTEQSLSQQALTTGIAPLPHRRLISLSGPDATKFLQGLITNNVDSTRLSPFYSAFLDARGRVLWDVFVWVWPELVATSGHWACYIEVDANEVELLKKHLKRHKLRSKIAIKDVPTEGSEGVCVWAAWGGAHESVQEWSEIAGFQDPRAPDMYRYLTNADRETIAQGLRPVDTKFYHIKRYLNGIPEGQDDMPRETALPMECNIDLNGGIDFKKGCYVGQELTIRTKHTGVVRKRILPVRFHAERAQSAIRDDTTTFDANIPSFDPSFTPLPSPGADIKALDESGAVKKGRAAGKIIAAIGNVGLASCRLENMTSMTVSAEGGTYKPGMQSGVDVDGQVVKVEPVLYDWFVQRKKAMWDREDRKRATSLKDQEGAELD